MTYKIDDSAVKNALKSNDKTVADICFNLSYDELLSKIKGLGFSNFYDLDRYCAFDKNKEDYFTVLNFIRDYGKDLSEKYPISTAYVRYLNQNI